MSFYYYHPLGARWDIPPHGAVPTRDGSIVPVNEAVGKITVKVAHYGVVFGSAGLVSKDVGQAWERSCPGGASIRHPG